MREIDSLIRLTPEEIYGYQPTVEEIVAMYGIPQCVVCHEETVAKTGQVCSSCNGGEN